MYEDKYCDRCKHNGNGESTCPVWELHLLHNYDQHRKPELKQALEMLIPREGVFNGQCRMFLEE